MCLGVPAKVISMCEDDPHLKLGQVDFGGITKTIALCFTPQAVPGDYVLVHVGFAISLIDEQHARELIQLIERDPSFIDELPN